MPTSIAIRILPHRAHMHQSKIHNAVENDRAKGSEGSNINRRCIYMATASALVLARTRNRKAQGNAAAWSLHPAADNTEACVQFKRRPAARRPLCCSRPQQHSRRGPWHRFARTVSDTGESCSAAQQLIGESIRTSEHPQAAWVNRLQCIRAAACGPPAAELQAISNMRRECSAAAVRVPGQRSATARPGCSPLATQRRAHTRRQQR
jgi:hypothetical protein